MRSQACFGGPGFGRRPGSGRGPGFGRVLFACAALLGPAGARAQPTAFSRALDSFDRGRYVDASRLFDEAAREQGPWQTAALAMDAKALFRAGRYDEARTRILAFLDRHAGSRYADDLRQTLSRASRALDALRQRPGSLGVILSLDPDEAAQSQALFNGLLLAVEAHNAHATGAERVRLIFRNIGSTAAGARRAVESLADEGVGLVMGALFSDQAREAAAAAEARQVVFVAPLATDGRVSNGRRFVFQANPTLEVRGRLMARFAVNGLLIRRFGVVSGSDPERASEAMAAAFEAEALTLGAEVLLRRDLEAPSDWFRLASLLPVDTLQAVRGLYVPLSGGSSERLAGAVLSSLERLEASVRVLGNSAWHDLPMATSASTYGVTYTNDFHVDHESPEAADFIRSYSARFGAEPGRLAHAGYDVTRFMIEARARVGNAGAVADALRSAPAFQGTGMRIDFRGGQVSEALFYHRYREGRDELVR